MGEVVVSSGGGTETEVEENEVQSMEDGGCKTEEEEEEVRWDCTRFLPPRMVVLSVLLVEADDSTRQIISALLRKCSYKVAAFPDGLKAWETLKGRPNSIDLILTEVELPSISGLSLLTLVMDHDICKNIPVIMMSSQDSVGVAYKCMLKGAADFLIKPVRKNELKNLWQHVWRRHTSSNGHVSQNLFVSQPKVEPTSENNAAASNHSTDHKACSDTQTQSSCTTRYLDPEIAYVQNKQVLQLKSKDALNSHERDRKWQEECVKVDKESCMPKCETDEESIRSRSKGALCYSSCNSAFRKEEDRASDKIMSYDKGVGSESHSKKANINCEVNGRDHELVEPSGAAINLIRSFKTRPKCAYGESTFGDGTNNFSFAPDLELSLKRFHSTVSKNQGMDEGHVLNHSNSSPFSWYNNTKTLPPLFPKLASNGTEPTDGASIFREQLCDQILKNTDGTSQWHDATLNKSGEYMTSLHISPSGQVEVAIPSPLPGIIPIFGISPPEWIPKPAGLQEKYPFQMSSTHDTNSESRNWQLGYQPFSDSTKNSANRAGHKLGMKLETEELRPGSPSNCQSNSSSLCNGVVNHHNNSAYGSICNRSDGNATAASTSVTRALKGVNDEGFLIDNKFKGMDCHRSIQREAALAKFRLKRKERCYDKKVRYQGRKRLAEKRTRVKGQFVRQVQFDTPSAATDSCT